MEEFEVYIIFSSLWNRFYIGQTNNFEERIIRHNKGQVKSTKNGIPLELVDKFEVSSRTEAVTLERKIKKRGAKRFLEDNNIEFGA
ncbi:GIY-YIG nuclease family protein [Aureibaculum algae]|uniref:GIY-YIG nuclease family protein n=1 Tax=Aureibaculum algae TaxID=2584122 RepID=A0A5B7TUA9_9FLAO|nr:GIY-YIG nuclease family protein [Aureibaculum algae]QCX39920.1 GIY-YIG nuclease family protein [Aureibaculum algae]